MIKVGDTVQRCKNFNGDKYSKEGCIGVVSALIGSMIIFDGDITVRYHSSNYKLVQPKHTGLSLVKVNNQVVLSFNGVVLPCQSNLYLSSESDDESKLIVQFNMSGINLGEYND